MFPESESRRADWAPSRLLSYAFVGSMLAAATVLAGGCYGGGSTPAEEDGTDSAPATTGPGGGPGSDSEPGGSTGGSDTSDPTDDPPEPSQAPSSRARVKFKGAERLARDLSDGLGLDRGELCEELSEYDCFGVHNIALAGVDPYEAAVYEPVPSFGVASPIAVDRIALTACGERAQIDFAQPATAVVFSDVADTADVDADALSASARVLYLRILRREPEDRELDELVAFYDEVPAGPGRAQTWAHLSCFAVATSLESLFY